MMRYRLNLLLSSPQRAVAQQLGSWWFSFFLQRIPLILWWELVERLFGDQNIPDRKDTLLIEVFHRNAAKDILMLRSPLLLAGPARLFVVFPGPRRVVQSTVVAVIDLVKRLLLMLPTPTENRPRQLRDARVVRSKHCWGHAGAVIRREEWSNASLGST